MFAPVHSARLTRILRVVPALFLLLSGTAQAGQVTVAVAANFRGTLERLETAFEAESGHQVVIVSGSTGQLYAQILNGAPYDVFLAADQERPAMIASRGLGAPDSLFSYASGRLALWSADPAMIGESSLEQLGEMNFRWFAIAEPETAPYGAASVQVLDRLGLRESLESSHRLVRGQNVAQTFAHVETRNAELGLVALSQVLAYDPQANYLTVPSEWHDPINQDLVALSSAAANQAAQDFLVFLRSEQARNIIRDSGYTIPSGATP